MNRWSFAAAAATLGELPHAVQASLDVQKDRVLGNQQMTDQMEAAAKSITRLVESGLWGSGPFSLALSGNETSFYLSVVNGG